jgi:Fur family peroxide stress response transcriptional regulator
MLEKLKSLGLKITPQRIAILEILKDNTSHPSAEDIYNRLKPNFPSLSLATVYNTLESLTRAGAIQEVIIDSKKRHYDPDTSIHSHFLCRRCSSIFDLEIKIKLPETPFEVDDFLLESISTHLYGTCPQCRQSAPE